MKRMIAELSTEHVQGLLELYCTREGDRRSTPESKAARQRQFDAELLKRRTDLGLSESEASEVSVVLEHNRRNLWRTSAPAAAPAASTTPVAVLA